MARRSSTLRCGADIHVCGAENRLDALSLEHLYFVEFSPFRTTSIETNLDAAA